MGTQILWAFGTGLSGLGGTTMGGCFRRWLHLIVLPASVFPPVDRLQVLGDACDLRATPRGAPKPCLDRSLERAQAALSSSSVGALEDRGLHLARKLGQQLRSSCREV